MKRIWEKAIDVVVVGCLSMLWTGAWFPVLLAIGISVAACWVLWGG